MRDQSGSLVSGDVDGIFKRFQGLCQVLEASTIKRFDGLMKHLKRNTDKQDFEKQVLASPPEILVPEEFDEG
jgi:hypothetical protein